MMSTIYIASKLHKEEMDSISMVTKFITDELGNLRKVLMEAITFESRRVVDMVAFPDAEQDKNFQLKGLEGYKTNLDNESTIVSTKLGVVRKAFKEGKGTVEVDNALRGRAGASGNTRLVLKPLDSLKPTDKLTHLAKKF